MVEFELTMGGWAVFVDKKAFGHIDNTNTFFTSPGTIKEFVKLSPKDLREIADKVEKEKP